MAQNWQFIQDLKVGLNYIGINETTATAGFLGGTVRGLIIRGGWINGIISAFVGCITSNYLAAPASLSATLNPFMWSEGTFGFLIGMSAFLICEGILKKAKDWSLNPTLPGARP